MSALLSTHGLIAGYGDMRALHGIDVHVNTGETVALIGANGAGKSTLLRSIMGLLPVSRDMVKLDGAAVGGTAPERMVQAGVAIVPEGRRLFADMTVEENLRVAIDHAAKANGVAFAMKSALGLPPRSCEKSMKSCQKLPQQAPL